MQSKGTSLNVVLPKLKLSLSMKKNNI